MIVKLKHYTVILEYPPDEGGTYLAHIMSSNEHEACTMGMEEAAKAASNPIVKFDPTEFFPSIVLAGWHDNIRPILVARGNEVISDNSRIHKAGPKSQHATDSSYNS